MSNFSKGFLIGGLFALLVGGATAVLAEKDKHKLEPCIQKDTPPASKKV